MKSEKDKLSPFKLGEKHGKSWNKVQPDNPFEKGTLDYQQYELGYDSGCEEFNKRRERDSGFRP